jgi:glycosyltransferase involved in cell wall biosynthesis
MITPLVSVVMPARDAEPFVAEAIDSVLAQGHEPLELIVVDDGSEDGTAAAAEAYGDPVRVLCLDGAGPGRARNHAIERARGELIAFLDADDVWEPGALAPRVEALRSDPALDLVFGHVSRFGDEPVPDGVVPGHLVSAMVARRSAFASVGSFREDLVAGEFVDWLARARDHGLRDRMLPDHVLRRRVHGANLGVTRRDAARADLLRTVKGTLDRRRGMER